MVIQGELYLLFNLTVDYFVLWAAGSWTGEALRPLRLLSASAVGAAYALLMLLPAYQALMAFPIKMALPLLMVALAFGWPGWRRYGRLVGAVFLIYFAAGGASLALALAPWEPDSGPVSQGIYWLRRANLTPVAVVGAIALARALGGLMVARGARVRSIAEAAITVQGQSVILRALIDTGSHLIEPVSGAPVIVAGWSDIKEIIPEAIQKAIEAGSDSPGPGSPGPGSPGGPWLGALEASSEAGWAGRMRLIPYRGAGVEGGLMLGFRPDRVALTREGKLVATRAAIIGILPSRVDPDRSYQAVCPPEILLD